MSDFTGYVCWDEQTVAATVATEAVSPSDNVFLATHAPLDIHRTTVSSGQAGITKVISEQVVLDDFLDRPTNNGVLIIPVLGESGAGKSHLVRWARARIGESTSGRAVVYLPKDNTSLAVVVELLLMGNQGSPFDEIRADLGQLGRDMTHEALQHALLDKLAAALLTASARADVPYERALVGEFGLRALLVDPYFRPKILRSDGLIARRAAHILDGRGESSGDIPMEFTAADLPLDIAELSSMAEPTRRIFRTLAANPQLQVAAHRMLQAHLDVAVMEATNLGVGRISKAFLQIRRAFAEQDREIVLLVEDFALVQGVQRDLLDAITETGEREGARKYAAVRTLMAVTSGYFRDLPPTVRTRIDAATPYRYELRVSLDGRADPATEQRVTDLMGRYLNAARVGRDRLEAEGVRSADTAPNKCEECPHRAECHGGFGTSTDGYGLYPYNRAALLRVVRASAPEERKDEFNPRAALAQAIRGVLQDHADDIRKGQFPDEAFEERFPRSRTGSVIPSAVQVQINKADPRDADRRRALLQYWGDAPTTLINLSAVVHSAFALPLLADLTAVEDPPEPVPDDQSTPSPGDASDYRPALARRLDRIEKWHTLGEQMIDDDARDIRSIIRQAILSRVSWTKPLTKEPNSDFIEKAWPRRAARQISIEGAAETIAKGATPMLRFDRTPENAQFFASLIKLMSGQREGTLGAMLRLREIAEEYAPRAREDVIRTAERGDGAVVAAMRVSLIGAAMAGVVQPGDGPDALLSAAVAKLVGHSRSDGDSRDPLWTRLLEVHLQERGELVLKLREAIGTAQGSRGKVHAIDAKRALRLVRVAAEQWTLGIDTPQWATRAARPLAGATVEAAVAKQIASLTELVREIRLRLPAGTNMRDVVAAVDSAFEAGERASMVPVLDLPEVRERNQAAIELRSAPVDRLERDLDGLAGEVPWPQTFAVAAEDRGSDLVHIRDYLQSSESWLDAGLRIRLSTPSEETRRLVEDLAAATAAWADITARLTGDGS